MTSRFRHALQDRSHPARRQGIELQAGVFGMQPHEQRLRHDGVADPGGGDDQRFHQRQWRAGCPNRARHGFQ
jgi:hypothetical protein